MYFICKENTVVTRERIISLYLIDVCIFPYRPNVDELKKYLSSIGASIVLTEEEMRKESTKDVLKVGMMN